MEFLVWGDQADDGEGKRYKNGWVSITEPELVVSLLKAGCCFKEEYIRQNLYKNTYSLKFGKSNYLLSYEGDNKWMMLLEKE